MGHKAVVGATVADHPDSRRRPSEELALVVVVAVAVVAEAVAEVVAETDLQTVKTVNQRTMVPMARSTLSEAVKHLEVGGPLLPRRLIHLRIEVATVQRTLKMIRPKG